MPKRELWPAGLCSEPVTHIGSCGDMMSTTSTRSGSSDSSYDFLSAEEKECLLFLEKTIGSLEAEADSGLSTDESEPATSPRSFRALPTATQQAPQGKSLSGKQHSEDQSLLNISQAEKGALCSPSQTQEEAS